MAYQTGSVASAAGLVAAIQAFAAANGWTLGGDVLSKGGCHVRITSPSASEVRIEGARNGSFAAPDICSRYSKLYLTTWPASATYHLFALTGPDSVWCVLNYNVTDHGHIGFGTLEKYGTWGGGQWFHAQHSQDSGSKDGVVFSMIEGATAGYYGAPYECGLFWSQRDGRQWDSGGTYIGKTSYLECDLRGYVWEATNSVNDEGDINTVHSASVFNPSHRYSPNAFNGQTVLTPFQLFLMNTDGHYMSIGHVGHLRFVKLANYNPGDILEIGSDKWKVFPWYRLDPAVPDGKNRGYSDATYSTGLLGVAVRYDGP